MSKEIDYFLEDTCSMFYIQDMGDDYGDRYVYPNDSLKYSLDSELVSLYDKFRDLIFPDTEAYYRELDALPIWVQSAGQDSDCAVTADIFRKWIQEDLERIPNLHRHLYLVDCQFLVGTIQNLLIGMEDVFVNYFIQIANAGIRLEPQNKDTTIFEVSWNSRRLSALLENYFVKAYSILDLLCKIGHEFQNPQTSFSSYKKIKSSEVLWGDRKKLHINGTKGTLFEECSLVRSIESLRNEIVHNGTWELSPKIFSKFEKGSIVERYMLFPDIEQGHLATVKSRKHFFGRETRVNDVLPKIHLAYKTRLINTIIILNGEILNSGIY